MKALIIAAGEGSRLKNYTQDRPKSMVEVGGKTLLEHIILRLKKAGLGEIVLVIGYQGEKLQNYFGDGSKFGVKIEYVQNHQWKRGNGLSVACGKKSIQENFFLLMSDHLFDHSIVEEMKKFSLPEGAVALGVDFSRGSPFIDLEDVTKVHTVEGKIISIGKEIPTYNAFDTGIFHCSPEFFTALEQSVANGDESISGGMRILAQQGKALVFDIKGKPWIDVDTEYFLKKAEESFCKE